MSHHAALQALLHTRHSCRAFKSAAVPKAVVSQILLDAGRAPSWCNAQPWKVIVTSGAETDAFRATMARAFDTGAPAPDYPFPTTYTGAHQKRRRTCGFQLYEAVGIGRGDREGRARQMKENYTLFGAPHVALITCPVELGPYGVLDCGGFITAFCLSAQAQGIGTVPQAALSLYSNVVRDHFRISEDRKVLAAISFGYPDEDAAINQFRTDRAELDAFVEWRD
ncbi:nitroreductase [Shimia marina]|uniref:Putative oxidoreductase n=1 Tax=Shimia marina TaxID=321267 RepID=A0A0P1FD90_9RHOB|nr:nitroreductase [Shimia marina]CUH52513.1 putative oxidoreductase [Shimia marina]SFE48690.1 Nitroreductase [Shimia marina]